MEEGAKQYNKAHFRLQSPRKAKLKLSKKHLEEVNSEGILNDWRDLSGGESSCSNGVKLCFYNL